MERGRQEKGKGEPHPTEFQHYDSKLKSSLFNLSTHLRNLREVFGTVPIFPKSG